MRFSKSRLMIFPLMFLLAGAQGCKTQSQTILLTIPDSLRAPCTHPTGQERVKTISDLAAYSIRQDAAIDVCDAARSAVVALSDAHNAALKGKKRWWER